MSGIWGVPLALAFVATYLAMVLDLDHTPGIFVYGTFMFVAGVATALLFR